MGKLLKSGVLNPEVIHYFSEKISGTIERHAGWLARPLVFLVDQLVRLFHRGTPGPLSEELDALATGMGIEPMALRRGLSLPDIGVLLQGLGSYSLLRFLPAGGCTSVATKLPGGGFLYGRNLDFAGVGTWDKHPMLLAIDPPAGSDELRHLVIAADGVLFGGITGANEAGLTLAAHMNYTQNAGISGVPLVLIGELVLRQAHTFLEAEEILRNNRPAGPWTFVITNLKNGETMAVESSPSLFLVRWGEDQHFVQTNHNMHLESRERENSSIGVRANSVFRMKKAFEMLESAAPSAERIAQILSYQEDPGGQLSSYHDILKGLTIQTALFERRPGQDPLLYLSIDEAPTAGGRFARFSLSGFWKNAPPTLDIVDLAHTPPAKREQQRAISLAYHRYFDEELPLEASHLLENQPTLDAALFRAVARYQGGQFAESAHEAETALQQIRFVSEPAYIRESLEWVRLAALFNLKHMDEARNLAQEILQNHPKELNHPGLADLCQAVLNGGKPAAWKLRLAFDFFSGDLSGRKE